VRVVFWISVAVADYDNAGYPVAVAIVSRWRRPTTRDDRYRPTVSLVIAAYNEETVLRQKLDNSLALDYPRDCLQIIVASDGSDDRTNAIAREHAAAGVVLHAIPQRGGKTCALNLTVPRASGEVLVFSDANTMYRPDAIWRLVRHFVDPTVGAVTGDVRLVGSAEQYAPSEGLYYRYERWLQRLESRLESVIGADGAMYALRRRAYAPVPASVIVDDFVISMNVALAGYRVIYDPEAVAIERGTLSSAEEYRRKVRIVAGGLQALMGRQGVPSFTQPLLLWCYVSHKLLRWLMPLLLIAAFASSAALAHDVAFYAGAFAAQVALYAAAVLRWGGVAGFRSGSAGAVPYYFCLVNGAALAGLWRALRRTQSVTWRRAARGDVA